MLYSLLRLRCHAQRALVHRNRATMVGTLPDVVVTYHYRQMAQTTPRDAGVFKKTK